MEATTARSGLGDPPRWLFHSLLALAALPVLWAFSVPGLSIGWVETGLVLWALAALVWLFQLVARLDLGRGWSWWFGVGPAMALIVVGLLAAHLPLKARWGLSRSSFAAAVARPAERAPGVGSVARIGSYTITQRERVTGGVLFYEAHGAGGLGDGGLPISRAARSL